MGALIAASMLAGRALAPAGQIVGLLMQYQGARTALESLDKLMAKPVERPAPRRRQPFVQRRDCGRDRVPQRALHLPEPRRLGARRRELQDHAGERVALIGRVGSGKSTIQRLIMGLYQPTDGAVLLDGIDLRQLDPADVRRNLGYVSQDVTAVLRHAAREHRLRPALRRRRGDRRRGRDRRPDRVRQPPPARLRHAGGRARRVAVGRPAPERRPGARGAAQRADAAARRADQRDGLLHRGADHRSASPRSRSTRRWCW